MDAPTAQIIDGKAIADEIRKEIAADVKALQEKYGKAREASPSNRAARQRTAGHHDYHQTCWDDQNPGSKDVVLIGCVLMQVPGLAVVLVGTKGDSATYVRMKRKACADLGIQSFSTDLPEDVTEEDLLKVCQPVTVCLSAPPYLRHQGPGKPRRTPILDLYLAAIGL